MYKRQLMKRKDIAYVLLNTVTGGIGTVSYTHLDVYKRQFPHGSPAFPLYAPLAQLVEQLTLNQWVPGSNP